MCIYAACVVLETGFTIMNNVAVSATRHPDLTIFGKASDDDNLII